MKYATSPPTIKKAVIAAAGRGLRFFPYSKSLPKEMLPIIDKPVIQWIAEDLVAAGVEEIIIVINRNKYVIKNHFAQDADLAQHLSQHKYLKSKKRLEKLCQLAKFSYIIQTSNPGSAAPLVDSAHLLNDQAFFYCLGDDFFHTATSTSSQLLDVFQQTKSSVLALHQPQQSLLSQYGVVGFEQSLKTDFYKINQVIEKPSLDQAPSDLAIAGHFLFTPDILSQLPRTPVKNQSLPLTDFLTKLPQLYGQKIKGIYCDVGTPQVYLESLVKVALADSQTSASFRHFLKQALNKSF